MSSLCQTVLLYVTDKLGPSQQAIALSVRRDRHRRVLAANEKVILG